LGSGGGEEEPNRIPDVLGGETMKKKSVLWASERTLIKKGRVDACEVTNRRQRPSIRSKGDWGDPLKKRGGKTRSNFRQNTPTVSKGLEKITSVQHGWLSMGKKNDPSLYSRGGG